MDIVPNEVKQSVQIEDTPQTTVVRFETRGYDYDIYTKSVEQLLGWLAAHPEYSVVGQPRRFSYDGSFVPDALKRSDIQIPVQRK